MQKTISIIVKGKVQGVNFRASAKQQAEQLDIRGCVQNLVDGNVQIIASGSEENLMKLVEWCETGPSSAIVTGVARSDEPYKSFDDFSIKR